MSQGSYAGIHSDDGSSVSMDPLMCIKYFYDDILPIDMIRGEFRAKREVSCFDQ